MKNKGNRPAIFLDRDGTLIEDVGVLSNPNFIRLFPDTIPALKKLQTRYLLFVVTNQSGIANGNISMEQVNIVNNRLSEILLNEGIVIEKFYVCPHNRTDRCNCIKPNPTFLLQAEEEYNIDLSGSYVIGDHPHDVLTGDQVGALGMYVLTGHGVKHHSELPKGRQVFDSIGCAADWIIDNFFFKAVKDGSKMVSECVKFLP